MKEKMVRDVASEWGWSVDITTLWPVAIMCVYTHHSFHETSCIPPLVLELRGDDVPR